MISLIVILACLICWPLTEGSTARKIALLVVMLFALCVRG
jgi:hypothetical protein